PFAHQAGHAHAVLVAQALGHGKGSRSVGVAHDLRQTFAVAQIDEDDAAVVAATMHPAKQSDSLPEVIAANLAGIARTHEGFPESGSAKEGKAGIRRPESQLAADGAAG